MVLELLHPSLVKLWRKRGFHEPTPPQKRAIPLILSGKNVLIMAPTGSGKTEAAVLPILSMMIREEGRGVKFLYITPLRTLNRDLLSRMEWWALRLDLRIGIRHGDTSQAERRAQALHPPDILITTPESLQLLLTGRRLKEGLRNLRWVVVDEVHELAGSRRGAQLSVLLEKLRFILGKKIQIIGLSATIGNPEEVGRLLAGSSEVSVVNTPVLKEMRIEVLWPDPRPDLSDLLMVSPDLSGRILALKEIIEKHGTSLIFANTRPMVELLGSRLLLLDERFPVYAHHGSLSQSRRVRIEEMLRRGEIKGVICTSSMELGIDVGHVEFVVQFNSPREVRRLIQRIGRSGHSLGRVSRGVVLVGSSDDALESLVLIRRLKKGIIEPSEIFEAPLDVLAHEVVGFSVCGVMDQDSIYEAVRGAYPYRNLRREDFLRLISFLEEVGVIRRHEDRIYPTRRGFKYFFGVLSTIPETRQYALIERSSGDFVGVLDDYFVSEYCDVGARFIVGGVPWEVVSLGEERVYVERTDDYWSSIPSWIGEEIPVPFEVAQEVGRMRRRVEELLEKEGKLEKILEESFGSEDVLRKALEDVRKMFLMGIPVPTDRRILVEDCGDVVVVHAHFGSKVNRALGKYIAHEASGSGYPVYLSEKPYRIVIRGANAQQVHDIIKGVNRTSFLRDLRRSVEESKALRWRLQQVARRMGILDPEVSLTRRMVDAMMIGLKGTPAMEEAVREVLERDLDVKKALDVVDMIERGEVEVVMVKGPTPITLNNLRSIGPLKPVQRRREVLSYLSFKLRVLQTFISFGCLDCGYVFSIPVREVEPPECPACGSKELVFDLLDEEELSRVVERIREGMRGRGSSLMACSRLLKRFGVKAVIARAAGLNLREMEDLLKEGLGGEDLMRRIYLLHREKTRRRFHS